MSTRFLTAKEKAEGVKHHFRHQLFNGAGFNFLGDTPVYLLAIHYGASNTQLGYISSTMFITGILLSVIPRILAGKNMVTVQFWAWLFRGLACLGYSALFFMEGQSAVYLIIAIYTLFCTFRVAGVIIYQPLIKMITTNRNKGTILSGSAIHFQGALSVSRIISFAVTSIKQLSGAVGILILQWAGVILNSMAAFEMRKIPCRQKIEYKPGRGVFKIFIESVKNREFKYSLFLSWTNTALLVIFGFIIPFLRRDAGLDSSFIFLYTLGAGLASVSAGLYSQGFADRIGSRPIILGSNLLLALCTILWILIPPDSGIVIYFIFGFLTTFSLNVNMILINRLVIRSMPEKDVVPYSTMLNFFAGIISFFVGLTAGVAADLSGLLNTELPNSYSLTFLLALLFCCISFLLAYKLTDAGSLSPKKAASIMFSPANLFTYQRIGQLRRTSDPTEKRTLLINLGNNNSVMAEEEMQTYLHNPLSTEKEEAIISLFSNPRPGLLPNLIAEAKDPGSYHRHKAIFALGGNQGQETETLLISLLDDPDPAVRSNAAKSLGRIGSKCCLEKVKKLSEESRDISNHMNYMIGIKHMDEDGIYLRGVFREEISQKGKSFIQSHYSLHARLQRFQPPLSDIYQSRNLSEGQGLHDFLDEARDDGGFLENHKNFKEWFKTGEFEKIWKRCRELLAKKETSEYFKNLKHSIENFPEAKGGYDDALAVVYFTYQLIKTNPEKGFARRPG